MEAAVVTGLPDNVVLVFNTVRWTPEGVVLGGMCLTYNADGSVTEQRADNVLVSMRRAVL